MSDAAYPRRVTVTLSAKEAAMVAVCIQGELENDDGAHPSPVQGYYNRDNAFFRQYHEQTKTKAQSDVWQQQWIHAAADRNKYMEKLGAARVAELKIKQHAYAAQTDFGY